MSQPLAWRRQPGPSPGMSAMQCFHPRVCLQCFHIFLAEDRCLAAVESRISLMHAVVHQNYALLSALQLSEKPLGGFAADCRPRRHRRPPAPRKAPGRRGQRTAPAPSGRQRQGPQSRRPAAGGGRPTPASSWRRRRRRTSRWRRRRRQSSGPMSGRTASCEMRCGAGRGRRAPARPPCASWVSNRPFRA